ncbi:MAG: bacteriohemerythrin [Nitrospinota bacterium]|nr:bacteriohemerythrin [Nitrospinota bacterium]
MYLEWNDQYSVQVKKFNAQHKDMLQIINAIHDELLGNNRRETQIQLLDKLTLNTMNHFSDEEQALHEINYSEILDHMDEHLNLLQELHDLKTDYMNNRIDISEELVGFLANWLIVHIEDMDKQYIPLMRDE